MVSKRQDLFRSLPAAALAAAVVVVVASNVRRIRYVLLRGWLALE